MPSKWFTLYQDADQINHIHIRTAFTAKEAQADLKKDEPKAKIMGTWERSKQPPFVWGPKGWEIAQSKPLISTLKGGPA